MTGEQPGQSAHVTKIRVSKPVQRPPHPWIHPCPSCGMVFWTKPWKGRPSTYCSDACAHETQTVITGQAIRP